MRRNERVGFGVLFGAAAGVALTGGAALASQGSHKVKADLASTGVVARAKGNAALAVKGTSNGRFEVKVQRLERSASYDVLVDGVKVGTIHTSGGGSGKARFSTAPRGHDVALGFDPRGDAVSVRDDAGEDVLTGTIPDDDGTDPADVVCCLPDDSGTECEDRTADACTAAGGTVSTATSCLPNPCGDSTAGAFVTCCLPDDDDTAECEDRTAAACLSEGGTVVNAVSCDPNPCMAAFPAGKIQCCLPHHSGTEMECEDRTADECAAQGGVDMGAGSCAPDPCAGMSPGGGGDDNGGGPGHP